MSTEPPETFRPRSAVWVTVGLWCFLAGFVAARGAEHGLTAAWRTVPVVLGLGVLVWLVSWRPRLRVDDAGVTLTNPFRTVHVPWAALIAVTTQYALTLHTPHGRFQAWAAPGPGRHRALSAGRLDLAAVPRSSRDHRGSVAVGDLPSAPSGHAAGIVRRRWEGLVEDGAIELGVADRTPVRVEHHLAGYVTLALTALAAAWLTLT